MASSSDKVIKTCKHVFATLGLYQLIASRFFNRRLGNAHASMAAALAFKLIPQL